jgi:ribonuclease HI
MARRAPVPRGGGLFGDAPPEHKPVASHQVNIDGGSRGNPGPAAYGVVIRDGKGEIVARLKKYIGHNTNNVAEYFGLIAALDYAQTHGIRALRVESDSELLVKQMRGQYKVKSEELKPLFEQNREADALVNQALDETSRPRPKAATEKAPGRENTIRLSATYRDGLLRPEEPLNLPDGTEVEILLRMRK